MWGGRKEGGCGLTGCFLYALPYMHTSLTCRNQPTTPQPNRSTILETVMRQEVTEEAEQDWAGEADADAAAERRHDRKAATAAGRSSQAARKRGRGGDADEMDQDEDEGEEEAAAAATAAGRAQRAARRSRDGGLAPSDWQTVGRAMHAGQSTRQRDGLPTGELALRELQEQLRILGLLVEDGALVALLEAASAAFGDMDSPDAAKYASSMPNFMWLPDEQLISFMS
jgi:hypothetical protein